MMISKEQKELFRQRVGKILEQRRLEKGLSRKELGVALGYEGNTAVQVVARFEAGRSGVPKTKIGKLLEILEITNKDFGLTGSKSLKNFITASGFLGSTMAPWSDAMIDFLESTEASFVKQTLEDDENSEGQDEDSKTELYQDVIRIMRLYRVQKNHPELGLLEKLDLMDTLSEGDEDRLAEMLVTLSIDPAEAYRVIEEHLVDRLKGPKK
jgi:transcriptional regulator with XRE-family HTH domain